MLPQVADAGLPLSSPRPRRGLHSKLECSRLWETSLLALHFTPLPGPGQDQQAKL